MKQRFKIHIEEETRGFGEDKRVLPQVDATVELTINVERIVEWLGHKAVRSRGKRARALAGQVVVRVIK